MIKSVFRMSFVAVNIRIVITFFCSFLVVCCHVCVSLHISVFRGKSGFSVTLHAECILSF